MPGLCVSSSTETKMNRRVPFNPFTSSILVRLAFYLQITLLAYFSLSLFFLISQPRASGINLLHSGKTKLNHSIDTYVWMVDSSSRMQESHEEDRIEEKSKVVVERHENERPKAKNYIYFQFKMHDNENKTVETSERNERTTEATACES